MAGEKPVREMDTIMVRVPDGMKSRIAERARANGRSMSSEVLSILESEMAGPATARIRELEALCKELETSEQHASAALREIGKRLEAAREELMRLKMVKAVRGDRKGSDGNP